MAPSLNAPAFEMERLFMTKPANMVDFRSPPDRTRWRFTTNVGS